MNTLFTFDKPRPDQALRRDGLPVGVAIDASEKPVDTFHRLIKERFDGPQRMIRWDKGFQLYRRKKGFLKKIFAAH